MKSEVNVKWTGNMSFEADISGHKVKIDTTEEFGGNNMGPRPKPFMMVALAGCTGMDVVSMLSKMRVSYDGLNIKIEGEIADDHPKKFTKMKVIYEFSGKDLPMDKLEKAVTLSQEKYCGVSANYKEMMVLEHEIRIV